MWIDPTVAAPYSVFLWFFVFIVVFLSAAFDNIDHNILIARLSSRKAAQRRLVRWTRYQYPTMVVHRGHLKWTKIRVCRVSSSACRHRDPWKGAQNWPRLHEWGNTQFHYHRIPNDSPTSNTQTTDFFFSAIDLPDSPGPKGPKGPKIWMTEIPLKTVYGRFADGYFSGCFFSRKDVSRKNTSWMVSGV